MATLQDDVMEGASPELRKMLDDQVDNYSNMPAGLLTHKQILVLSKAFGLVPVNGREVVSFFQSQLGDEGDCGRSPSSRILSTIADVEDARKNLSSLYETASSYGEVIAIKKRSVALSYVQARRDPGWRPYYHQVMCRTIRGHFGAISDEDSSWVGNVWFDQLAKYQNPRCSAAWGKMGLMPYLDIPVLAVLPMCTSFDPNQPLTMSIPLLESRFPLDAYLQGALHRLSASRSSFGNDNSNHNENSNCEFTSRLKSLLGDGLLEDSLKSCVELYGVAPDGQMLFPLMSPWFRTWPLMERHTGIAHKGLYMESHSWNVAMLVVAMMEVLGDAASKALESPEDPFVKDTEALVESDYERTISVLSEEMVIKRIPELHPVQVREYLDLLEEVQRTVMAIQFNSHTPSFHSSALQALKERICNKTGSVIAQYSSRNTDWEAMDTLCNCDQVFRFLRSSFVTHADCYAVSDKVDMAVGLLRGLGGTNSLSKLEGMLLFEDLGTAPATGHEVSRARVVELALAAGSERVGNSIPFLCFAPIVNAETCAVWMKDYLGMESEAIAQSNHDILTKLTGAMTQIAGVFVRVFPDMTSQILICSSAEIFSALDSLSDVGRIEQDSSENLEIFGTLHCRIFRDNAAGIVVVLWLVRRMLVRGRAPVDAGHRVVIQLSWRRQTGEDGPSGPLSFVDCSMLKAFKEELAAATPQLFASSNPVIFWRDGSKASGLQMKDFFVELREGIEGLPDDEPGHLSPLNLF